LSIHQAPSWLWRLQFALDRDWGFYGESRIQGAKLSTDTQGLLIELIDLANTTFSI
jgi:hypothetical protein